MNANKRTLSISKYQAGSYIIIENQPNSGKNQGAFFIIQSGKVRVETLVGQMLGTKQQLLGPGGFFGVISAMSAQESNETAVAMSECSLIVVKRQNFGNLVEEASSIALKIVRSLSNNLRHYDNELAKRMIDKERNEDDPDNLFHIGKFFHNEGNLEHAARIFSKYVQISSSASPHVEQAQAYLDEMSIPVIEPSGFNRTYSDGEMICAEYMPGSELYIIQSGRVKVTKIINDQEMIIAILNTGDIVGEMSLLNNRNRAANIIAYGDANIMAVNKDNFEKIFQNKELVTKLLLLLADRLWAIYKQLANLLIENPLTRLWDTLLTQLLKQHVHLDKKARYQFPFGKTELLNMSGLQDDQPGGAAFAELMAQRCMCEEEEGIVCNDLDELHKIVSAAHKAEIRSRKMKMAKHITK